VPQLESYPLEAKLALAWRADDLGRFGRVYYSLDQPCGENNSTAPEPSNIHNFYSNSRRPMSLGDYKWNTVYIETLSSMENYIINKKDYLMNGNAKDSSLNTAWNIRDMFGDYRNSSYWIYPRPGFGPCEDWTVINGETTRPTNINNANYEWQLWEKNGKGYGVSDDFNAFYEALLKSVGIATVPFDYIWNNWYDKGSEPSHEESLFYDPSSGLWNYSAVLDPVTDSMDFLILRPPAIQTDFFDFYVPERGSGFSERRIPNLYYKELGVAGSSLKSRLDKGIPTSQMYSYFFDSI
jgi:hypothetical protein